MQVKTILKTLLLLLCTFSFIGCNDKDTDFGYRAFMDKATIVGDSKSGYHCYFDGGGLAISYDVRLAGVERGYFAFHYMEEDWTIADNAMYINNVRVSPYDIYDVIQPISIDQAGSKDNVEKDGYVILPISSLSRGYRGYFDLNTALSVVNLANLERIGAKIKIVYDPAKQTSDTLSLQLFNKLNVPDNWSNTTYDYGAVSCDISSLATKKEWCDSVTIVVQTEDEKILTTKISKYDFLKPDVKLEKSK